MLRRIIAVLLGIVGGGMVVSFFIRSVRNKYPMPPDAHLMTEEANLAFIQSLPKDAFYMILGSHFLGGLLASFIAAALASSTKRYMGYIAGFVILILVIMTLGVVPQPSWMSIVDPVAVVIAVLIGAGIGSRVGQKA